MAINAGSVFINVVANIGPFRQQMLGLGSQLSAVGARISRVGTALSRGLTLPIGLAGFAATKLAVDYDAAFARIEAITNLSQKRVDKFRESVLQLAVKTAQGPEELANALYFLASAGLSAKQVQDTLTESAKASAIGLGETADVAKLTANALNAYTKSGLTAKEVTDALAAAVREGTAEPDEFAHAMGRILPIASKANVEFVELAGSLAQLSNIGLNVNEGVTAMRGLLQALVAPGTAAAETLKKIGLSTQEVRDQLGEKGVLFVIREIEALTKEKWGKGWLDRMRDIIPNIRALTGSLGLTVDEAEDVDQVFQRVAHSAGDMGEAFKTTREESEKFKLERLLTELKVLGIEFGEAILPVLHDIVPVIRDIIKSFTDMSDGTKKNIVVWGLLVAALGPVVRIFGALTQVMGGVIALGRSVVGAVGRITTAIAAGGAASAASAGGLAKFTAGLKTLGPAVATTAGGTSSLATGMGAVSSAAGPFALALAAIAGVAIAAKIAIDNDNEAVDHMVEQLRNGKLSIAELEAENERLTTSYETAARELREDHIPALGLARGGYALMENQIEANDEAIRGMQRGFVDLAREWGISAGTAENFVEILNVADPTTRHFRNTAVRLIAAIDFWGGSLGELTRRQVQNLLVQGDEAAALKILRQRYREVVGPAEKHADEVNRAGREARVADHAQRLLAGGIENVGKAVKIAGDTFPKTTEKVKGLRDKLKEVGQQKPKPKVTVDTTQAAGALGRLETHLTNITKRDWVANVRVTTSGGSTGFHLLEMLNQALEKVTQEDWNANVEVTASGPRGSSLQEVGRQFNEMQRMLEKLGQVASRVWGLEFPKAYRDDLKAFREATNEKSRLLTRALNQAQKDFDKLKDKINSFKDAIKSGFADAASLIGDALEGLARTKELTVQTIDFETGELGTGTVTVPDPINLGQFLTEQVQAAKQFAAKLSQLAAAGLAPALLAELASQGPEALPLVDALLAGGKDLIKDFNEAHKAISQFAKDTAESLAEDKFGGALRRAGKRVDALNERIEKFVNQIGRHIDGFIEALQTRRLTNEIESLIHALRRAMQQLGINVPHAAHGAIVKKPTLLLAGEAGPEAIVPLSGSAGGYGSVNVYLDVRGNAIYAKDLAAEVRDVLLKDKRFKGTLEMT